MLDKFVDELGRAISRCNFLGRTVSACSALVVAAFGLDRIPGYTVVGCCDLRHSRRCKGDNPLEWACAGTWCWTCGTHRTTGRCTIFRCYECYNINAEAECFNSDCEGGFGCGTIRGNIVCSKAINTHQPCYGAQRPPKDQL